MFLNLANKFNDNFQETKLKIPNVFNQLKKDIITNISSIKDRLPVDKNEVENIIKNVSATSEKIITWLHNRIPDLVDRISEKIPDSSVEKLLLLRSTIEEKISAIIETDKYKYTLDQLDAKSHIDYNKNRLPENNSKSLECYLHINSHGEKIYILSYLWSKKIYKAFKLNKKPELVVNKELEMLDFMYQEWRRRFFKKIKNNKKSKKFIYSAFKIIWKSKLITKESPSERLKARRIKKNKEIQSVKNKEKEIKNDNIDSDYKTLFPLTRVLSTVILYNKSNLKRTTNMKKIDQIKAAKTLFTVLLSRVKKEDYNNKFHNDDSYRLNTLKNQIKKYLSSNMIDSKETDNRRLHLINLLTSATEILINNVESKKS